MRPAYRFVNLFAELRCRTSLPNGTLKTDAGFPHGMPTTHAQVINADILAFVQGHAE